MAKNKAKPASRKKAAASAPLPSLDSVLDALPKLTTTIISERELNKLLNADNRFKGEIDGVVGQLREEIKFAVENKHLHKGAYADLKRYDRMEPEKLAERFLTLLAYMRMRGLFTRINSVERLDLGDEPPADDDEAKPAKAKAGPKFGDAVNQLAQSAGASTAAE